MPQAPDAQQNPPRESKFPAILRALGLAALVLILWSADKVAVSRLPGDSARRYVIGAIIISVGLAVVITITDRLNNKSL